MYGNDEPIAPKKPGKKSKGKPAKDKRKIDEDILSKMPPAYPTTDVSVCSRCSYAVLIESALVWSLNL